jgi:hypothetical protein
MIAQATSNSITFTISHFLLVIVDFAIVSQGDRGCEYEFLVFWDNNYSDDRTPAT